MNIDGVKFNSNGKEVLTTPGGQHKTKPPYNEDKHEKGQTKKNTYCPSWKEMELEKLLRGAKLNGLNRGIYSVRLIKLVGY